MKSLKAVFVHPVTKAVLIGILTAALAIISGISTAKNKQWLLIIIGVVYVALAAVYAVFETNYYSECQSLERDNRMYEDALRRVHTICRSCAKTITEQIHEIQDKGRYNPNAWNFKMACDVVCEQLCECLRVLLQKQNSIPNIGVGYVRLDESDQKNDTIVLCSYSQTRNNDSPKILNIKRNISNRNEYHDAELFKLATDEEELLLTPEEVSGKFVFKQGTKRKKYKQFIAVPVFCDKTDGGKMVGLLEVTCLEEQSFPNDQRLVKAYVDSFLRPYAYLILILHKMEKGLLAAPKSAVVSEGKKSAHE